MQIRSIKGYRFHLSKILRIMEQEETFEKFYIQGIPNTRNLQLNESKFSFNLQQMHTYNACLKLFIPKNYYNFSISIN